MLSGSIIQSAEATKKSTRRHNPLPVPTPQPPASDRWFFYFWLTPQVLGRYPHLRFEKGGEDCIVANYAILASQKTNYFQPENKLLQVIFVNFVGEGHATLRNVCIVYEFLTKTFWCCFSAARQINRLTKKHSGVSFLIKAPDSRVLT